jgi:hypothetical protein
MADEFTTDPEVTPSPEVTPDIPVADLVQPWDAVGAELEEAGIDLGENPLDTIRDLQGRSERIEELERNMSYQSQALQSARDREIQQSALRDAQQPVTEEKPWHRDVWNPLATKDFTPWVRDGEFIPETPKEVRDSFNQIQQFSDNFRNNPPETIWGMLQPKIENTIKGIIHQQVNQRESNQAINQFEHDNQDWLYEADPRSTEGNFVAATNPVDGQRVASQYGRAMSQFYHQARNSGVQDENQALSIAKQMLASQISQQQVHSSSGELEYLRAENEELRYASERADPKETFLRDAANRATRSVTSGISTGGAVQEDAIYNEKSFLKNAKALAKEQGVI